MARRRGRTGDSLHRDCTVTIGGLDYRPKLRTRRKLSLSIDSLPFPTENRSMTIDHTILVGIHGANLPAVVRDKEGIDLLRTRIRERREALRKKIGTVDLAVPLIRELRNE